MERIAKTTRKSQVNALGDSQSEEEIKSQQPSMENPVYMQTMESPMDMLQTRADNSNPLAQEETGNPSDDSGKEKQSHGVRDRNSHHNSCNNLSKRSMTTKFPPLTPE